MNATSSWEADIDLEFRSRDSGTWMSHCRHRGPLRVQRPFYPEGGRVCHVYLLHPPGGVVGGDALEIRTHVGRDAHVLLTTPAAGKFYRSTGPCARVVQQFRVEEDGVLEWLPQDNIYHKDARVEAHNTFLLHENASLISMDISCFGLPASREGFTSGYFRQQLKIEQDNHPTFIERTRYSPDHEFFDAAWGMNGYSVSGLLLATPADESHGTLLREQCEPPADALSAVTVCDSVLSLRCLGDDAETVRTYLHSAWQRLRPEMLKRRAEPPRIWAT